MARRCLALGIRRGPQSRSRFAAALELRVQPGNMRPERRGPLFWYLKLRHSRYRQAFHLHLRTEKVAPTSTTVRNLFQRKLLSRRRVRPSLLHPLKPFFLKLS
jgi:hypothetical protein